MKLIMIISESTGPLKITSVVLTILRYTKIQYCKFDNSCNFFGNSNLLKYFMFMKHYPLIKLY